MPSSPNQAHAPRSNKSNPLAEALAERDKATIQMVQRALANQEVLLAFQPVVSTQNPEQPAFYEGLIRVMDPTGRIIPAAEFIEQIEHTELGRQIDCLALKLGLETLAAVPGLRLSINMSARSIGHDRWMQTLNQGLSLSSTVAERLILEVTESSAMEYPEQVCAFMDDLQHRSITFALDDFGAGHTSFRYLKDFFFDILKIDGHFIRGIHKDPDNQVLASALMSLGRHFEMFTVAESVETPEDAAFLTQLGVDCMQGYLFGAPTTKPHWIKAGDRRVG
ncbi:putative cyclic di-GMP phosphodiesterase, EAL domain protein [Candidatus Rhodobacter oscarellae]|uniref:Putative cyclic di-GMP phosphodiesterase, EAL domain protein n=1 Tax=Candidatus Rhodobacter oscarellae TaxID=1675527 RepID=A0A0J9EAU3_9RHOB|nr:EAL domain-containing protein [Candidatus Rhodobacter lobularis]KMW59905.1 putative cyclic di-GMP phosphodiesterase, EAL domain protein [Candidatus Rhodobacter lobularis]